MLPNGPRCCSLSVLAKPIISASVVYFVVNLRPFLWSKSSVSCHMRAIALSSDSDIRIVNRHGAFTGTAIDILIQRRASTIEIDRARVLGGSGHGKTTGGFAPSVTSDRICL